MLGRSICLYNLFSYKYLRKKLLISYFFNYSAFWNCKNDKEKKESPRWSGWTENGKQLTYVAHISVAFLDFFLTFWIWFWMGLILYIFSSFHKFTSGLYLAVSNSSDISNTSGLLWNLIRLYVICIIVWVCIAVTLISQIFAILFVSFVNTQDILLFFSHFYIITYYYFVNSSQVYVPCVSYVHNLV